MRKLRDIALDVVTLVGERPVCGHPVKDSGSCSDCKLRELTKELTAWESNAKKHRLAVAKPSRS